MIEITQKYERVNYDKIEKLNPLNLQQSYAFFEHNRRVTSPKPYQLGVMARRLNLLIATSLISQ